MKLKLVAALAFLFGACAVLPSAAQSDLAPLSSFPTSTLTIDSRAGAQQFEVWIADTPTRQAQGLMFVRELPGSQGMLFINDPPRVASFWMRNTFIPLDMLFIDERGRIVEIFANTTPLSDTPIGARRPVRAVLELRGGESERRGIKKGDRVNHSAFRKR